MENISEQKYNEQQKRIKYLSKQHGQKEDNLQKIKVDGLDKLKKLANKPPSKKFIENLKSQGWYQIECPRCKYSNRKWLDEKKSAFDCPIRTETIQTKRTLKIFYYCNNCNCGWRG